MPGLGLVKAVARGLAYLYEEHERTYVSRKEKTHLQGSQVDSLLQELRYTFWVLENNVKELQGQQTPSKGLMPIPTTHVECILFSAEPSLLLEQRSLDAMEKYLRLANHHNVLIQNGFLQMGASEPGGPYRIFADWSDDGKGTDPIPMTLNEIGPSIAHFARLIMKDLEMTTL